MLAAGSLGQPANRWLACRRHSTRGDDNLAELCQLIPSLNVTKDQELENLRQRVLRVITPFDIEDVRENEAVREDLKSKAAGILAAMGFNQPITQQREAA
jgi:hypothetical protein